MLSGDDDKRAADRAGYAEEVPICTLRSVRGYNVLPWESPSATCNAIVSYIDGIGRS